MCEWCEPDVDRALLAVGADGICPARWCRWCVSVSPGLTCSSSSESSDESIPVLLLTVSIRLDTLRSEPLLRCNPPPLPRSHPV